MNAIAGMSQALGDLDRVVSIIKTLNFVACSPDFTDVHLVSTAMADRFVEVFGEEKGIGCRATIGVQSLANNFCFETWIELKLNKENSVGSNKKSLTKLSCNLYL